MNKNKLHAKINSLGEPCVDFWRETLANLRQLHNDIWNGVRFFLAINAILLAGFSTLLGASGHEYIHCVVLAALPIVGILLTWQARSILKKHRDYYLDMLIRKTFIEKELGLYDYVFYESSCGKCPKERYDLSFPWQVPKHFLDKEFLPDPAKWRKAQERRKGLITTTLFNIYTIVIVIHALSFASVLVLFKIGYFNT